MTGDSNYKADHVRQTGTTPDAWLGEGGGMIPLRTEYQYFLDHAKERRTVSIIYMLTALWALMHFCRKLPAKILSERLPML